MGNVVELSNIEINEYCKLNIETGEKFFSKTRDAHNFSGLYFKDDENFFALYPTLAGPVIYYRGREYSITKELSISLKKNGKSREFKIDEYGIQIEYMESVYIGFDIWSDEIDVDLFYRIEQSYKTDAFYEQYHRQ